MGCNSSSVNTANTKSPYVDNSENRIASTKAPPKFNEKYELGSILGQGSYSLVRAGQRISDGKKVAVKIVSRNHLQREDELSLRVEVETLMSLNHPNIVKAFDFFEERDFFYVVLEHLEGGELFDRLIEKEIYTEAEARDLSIILLKAIKYCHDKDLIHRDIKPENILLTSKDDDINLKLVDFGFAMKTGITPAKVKAGTPGYIAPEILQDRPQGKPVDMWSLGVVLFMILGGYPPFYDSPDEDISIVYRRICNAEYEFHPANWDCVSEEAKSLIRGLLVLDPRKRLTIDEALNHSWIMKVSREELVVRNLDRTLVGLRGARLTRGAAKLVNIAADAVRKLSSSNLKSQVVNEVAIDVIRKISGANLNDAVIVAARKISGASVGKLSQSNNSQSSRI